MSKKSFPKKPFRFGKFVVEYREESKSPVHFLKEEINTEEDANAAVAKLEADGKQKVTVKQIG
jgi:hypothetical protein